MGIFRTKKRVKSMGEFFEDALKGDISVQKEEIDLVGTAIDAGKVILAGGAAAEIAERVSKGGVEKQKDEAKRKLKK